MACVRAKATKSILLSLICDTFKDFKNSLCFHSFTNSNEIYAKPFYNIESIILKVKRAVFILIKALKALSTYIRMPMRANIGKVHAHAHCYTVTQTMTNSIIVYGAIHQQLSP
jgi:hypothetical protein